MVIAGNEKLVTHIVSQTRKIVLSPWYKQISGIKLERSKVLDFATTAGGGVVAFSIDGSITGRGAELIIADDLVDVKDASNVERLEEVNERFHTLVQSRLNNAKQGCIVVIAHRLHPKDLSGSLLKARRRHHIALPMIATEDKTYWTGHRFWHRKAGELLRPAAYDDSDIEYLLANTHNPDFDTYYLQDVSGGLQGRIKRDHFPRFEPGAPDGLPVVLSIDPGDRGGSTNDYSVMQAWCLDGEKFFLLSQFREQCGYRRFRKAYRRFVLDFGPSVALIEATGQGRRLLEEEEGKQWPKLVEILPGRRSKVARLRPHVEIICACRVHLPRDAEWAEHFIAECIGFPNDRFDDQVDALTQALDFLVPRPKLDLPPARANSVVASKSSLVAVGPHARHLDGQARGVVVVGSRGYGFLY
jgi:predicted phage terminase large subunit-like protein